MSKSADEKDVAEHDRDRSPQATRPVIATPPGGGPGGPGSTGGAATAGSPGGGFFSIYKSGQGYWTRLLTFLAFLLLGAMTAHFIYSQTQGWIGRNTALGIAAGLFIAWLIIQHLTINKPKNAEFLIATDSEMKKVNWTSRRELIGSTKVVIFFMFLITAMLFLYDLVFHTFFWAITVLETKPPYLP